MTAEDEMVLISEAARQTGVAVGTIRFWGKQGQLSSWEARAILGGYAYYTTVKAVNEKLANRSGKGRPIQRRKTGS